MEKNENDFYSSSYDPILKLVRWLGSPEETFQTPSCPITPPNHLPPILLFQGIGHMSFEKTPGLNPARSLHPILAPSSSILEPGSYYINSWRNDRFYCHLEGECASLSLTHHPLATLWNWTAGTDRLWRWRHHSFLPQTLASETQLLILCTLSMIKFPPYHL